MSIKSLRSELAEIEKAIGEVKERKAKAEGRMEELKSRLKGEFRCKTFEDVKALEQDLADKATKTEEKFQKAVSQLENKYAPYTT